MSLSLKKAHVAVSILGVKSHKSVSTWSQPCISVCEKLNELFPLSHLKPVIHLISEGISLLRR